MARTKIDKPYTPAELEAELSRLKPPLGSLTTNEQIRAACMERELAEFDKPTEQLKTDAFWEHLHKISPSPKSNLMHHKVWDEITLYDRMGATSQDLVDGETLAMDSFVEGTSLLSGCEEFSAAKARLDGGRISGSEFFRLFLRLEKVKHGIDKWTPDALYDLRCRLHECVTQMDAKRAQPEQPDPREQPMHSQPNTAETNMTRPGVRNKFDLMPTMRKKAIKAAIAAEVELLTPKLGSLETLDQIAEACNLLQTLRVETALSEDITKLHAVREYINRQPNCQYISSEIGLYSTIGQTSAFLLDGPKFDMDPTKAADHHSNKLNIRSLLELGCAVESWSYLSLEGALGHFLMHDEVHNVKLQKGSAAELFRAFVRIQDVETWNFEEMYKLNQTIYKVAEDFRRQRRIKQESVSTYHEVMRQRGFSVPSTGSSPRSQVSVSYENHDHASSSTKHGLPAQETNRSKRPRTSSSKTKKQDSVTNTGNSQEGVVDEEDLYDATPSPESSSSRLRSSSTMNTASAVSPNTSFNSEVESDIQSGTVCTSEKSSQLDITVGLQVEDVFQAKLNQVAEDLRYERNENKATDKALATAAKDMQVAEYEFEEAYRGVDTRFKKVDLLCSDLSSSSDSTSIRAAAKACMDFGLAEGATVMKLLQPAIAIEQARENYENSASKLRKLESKLKRLSDIFDED
ncbi:hypothetical protein VTL71DRAFT_10437 [Oculimacula yallundae]|uniref:Uncharacterized protein n=1 Tax=Oculimacula yallundae TaxID=86028 RepID=A0ABR4CT08_9HELO